MTSPLTEIPDHLLAEIFLRLPDPEDLVRASAACVSFYRLTTDDSFLRRFRRLHVPSVLGFLQAGGMFRSTMPPHPSAPAARTLARAADIYFSFIPSRCHWTVQDIRGGRVLLARDLRQDELPLAPVFRDLAVCDPLHRRTGQWQAAASKAWSDLGLGERDMAEMSQVHPFILSRHYAYGCFCWDWVEFGRKKLLLLDTTKMEFFIANPPRRKWSKVGIAIVEAG
ncbi:hypothetical protein VPH35_140274 [Triticum aestivum]